MLTFTPPPTAYRRARGLILVAALGMACAAACGNNTPTTTEAAPPTVVTPGPETATMAPVQATDGRTVVATCTGELPSELPSSLPLSCDTDESALAALTWTQWGEPVASATGVYVRNDCNPDCPHGRKEAYPVSVTATDTVPFNATSRYATLIVDFPGLAPGRNRTMTFPLAEPRATTT